MGNNTLEIKHVADLLNMHFNIPSYQRGYRWEEKQVCDLLDDLYNFSLQIESDKEKAGKFYCIQPLAVVKNKKLSKEGQTVYDVIDGQQRLTTLYLILSYLQDARNLLYRGLLASSMFSLKYESRKSSFFDNEEFKTSSIDDALSNIDFFYMTRAYKAIEEWFKNKNICKGLILRVIIPENYIILQELDGGAELAKESNKKQNDVRFVWYEIETKEETEPMEVFSQLNYGKTALTSTELVKALLFQCDIYTEKKSLMSEITFRRSCEWDSMEKQLNNPYMWSMFIPSEHEFASHIDIVLLLVCNELNNENNFGLNINSKDFTYQVCSKFLGNSKNKEYADKVEKIWGKIQTTYTAICNWYNNRDTYHFIGLLIWLKEFKNKDFNYTARFNLIISLMREYSLKPKDEFVKFLKKEIAVIIHIDDRLKTSEGDVKWGLKYINYNDNALQIIRILVAFNVEELRRKQNDSTLFPFHLLRKYNVTSLEHIHPQNFDLDNIKLDTLKSWLEVKGKSLEQINKYNNYSCKIAQLKSYTENEDLFNQNKEKAYEIINDIDKEFYDLAGMSDEQMHTLYNMALVDKDTNAALSNHLLDRKREILFNREDTYIMPSTQKVFVKYYSPANETNILPKLWASTDREAYFKKIEEIYNDFNSYYKKK